MSTRNLRIQYMDQDNRRDPQTARFCICCHKDIKPGKPFRAVHLIDGGPFVLHPDDEASYVSDGGEMGWWRIGPDCAKRLGIEFTHPPESYPVPPGESVYGV